MDEMVLHAALAGMLDKNNGYLEENLAIILAAIARLKKHCVEPAEEGLGRGVVLK